MKKWCYVSVVLLVFVAFGLWYDHVFSKIDQKERESTTEYANPIIPDSEISTESENYDEKVVDKNDFLSQNNNYRININTADADALTALPGIGEKKARAVVEYRSENGGFEKIEDIKNVDGIGDAIFDDIKSLITI